MMNPGGMMGWGYGMGPIGWLLMLLFWGLIIAGAVLLVRWLWSQGGPRPVGGGSEPLEILRRRYARGEIDKEEYDRMRRDLR